MTSVVSRIGTASTRIGSRKVATVVPATFQLADRPRAARKNPSTCEPESPMKTSALPRRLRLNGRKPRQARAPARASASAAWLGWTVTASIAKKPNAIAGERRGEPVHVVEQVERVRHADEPEEREGPGDHLRVDQLHVGAGREHQHGGSDLRAELDERRQGPEVVDQPGDEQQRDAAVDAGEGLGERDRPGRDGEPHAGGDAREDSEAAEQWRRALVPAVGGRRGDEPAGERRAQERPDRQDGRGESGDGRECAHRR